MIEDEKKMEEMRKLENEEVAAEENKFLTNPLFDGEADGKKEVWQRKRSKWCRWLLLQTPVPRNTAEPVASARFPRRASPSAFACRLATGRPIRGGKSVRTWTRLGIRTARSTKCAAGATTRTRTASVRSTNTSTSTTTVRASSYRWVECSAHNLLFRILYCLPKFQMCTDDEMADFPRRMRDWLFNIMRDMADRQALSPHYLKMEREAESNFTRKWVNSAIWKWCDLDEHPHDRWALVWFFQYHWCDIATLKNHTIS